MSAYKKNKEASLLYKKAIYEAIHGQNEEKIKPIKTIKPDNILRFTYDDPELQNYENSLTDDEILKQMTKIKTIKHKLRHDGRYKTNNINTKHQADILSLSFGDKKINNKGQVYVLVVVDIYNRFIDARIMLKKDTTTTFNKFKEIYDGNILKKPKIIMTDYGLEFSNKKDFKDIDVSLVNVKKHLGIIDAKIYKLRLEIEKYATLYKTKNNKPLIINKSNIKIFQEFLNKLIKSINNYSDIAFIKDVDESNDIIIYKNEKIIPIGSIVRVHKFKNVEYDAKKGKEIAKRGVTDKFRHGDIRWSRLTKIRDILFSPNSPILYLVDQFIYQKKAGRKGGKQREMVFKLEKTRFNLDEIQVIKMK